MVKRGQSPADGFDLIKRKGNEAFLAGDYDVAKFLYSYATSNDPGNYIYALNRAQVNLNLRLWKEAENDAVAVIEAKGVTAVHKQKARWRLYQARKGQRRVEAAREALDNWVTAGGSQADAEKERAELEALENNTDVDEVASSLENAHISDKKDFAFSNTDEDNEFFEVKEDAHGGKGAFARKPIERGTLILAEKPLLPSPASYKEDAPLSAETILALVERLTPAEVARSLTLKNSRAGDPYHCFAGIWQTNAFSGAGVCATAARFNHSCVPNARYSWHAESRRQRIFALRRIEEGEEICVSYLMNRNIYGSSRAARRAWLEEDYRFVCMCAVCDASDKEVAKSDHRRNMLARIWRALPTMQDDPRLAVSEVASAIRIMREEGYHADADDFASEAVNCCAAFSDWESAKYWAGVMYESRRAEFGEDSRYAREAKAMVENPGDRRRMPMAGMFKGVSFTDIRV
ncbi:hypothetical protein EV715DRAFT_289238 [Schizophyllum commune]